MFGEPSRNYNDWIKGCLDRLGNPKIMKVDLLGTPWLSVNDLSFIKEVMLSKAASFPKHVSDVGGVVIPMIGDDPSAKCLLLTETLTDYVKAVRKIYATAFQTHNLKRAIPKLDKVLQNMVTIIEANKTEGPVDFQSLCVKMITDAIGSVAFDLNLGALDGSGKVHDLLLKTGYIGRDRILNPMKRLFLKLFPNSKTAKEEAAVIAAMTSEWDKLTNTILERDDPPEGEEAIWSSMRKLKDPEMDKPIPFNSLRAELATVVLGGLDTTGHQLGWLFALLASHPHIAEKLLEELRSNGLYGPDSREVSFEDLGKLTYLTAIIREGMRIGYVTAGSFLRVVPKDMTILGHRVPKNALITFPGTRVLNTEREWGDPQTFRPERWLTDEDMSGKYSIMFGFGSRDCIGQKLAMLEMRLAIIKIVTQYELVLEGRMDELLQNTKEGLVIEARDGVWIHVEPRSLKTQSV